MSLNLIIKREDMKHTLHVVCLLLLAVGFASCGGDDDSYDTISRKLTLRMSETYPLKVGAYSSAASSDNFVAVVDRGEIVPQHVGQTTVDVVGKDARYVYKLTVLPTRTPFHDLGEYLFLTKKEIEKADALGSSIGSDGSDVLYQPKYGEQRIAVRYSSDGKVIIAMLTVDGRIEDELTGQLEEYYQYIRTDDAYRLYANALSEQDATVLVLRKAVGSVEQIVYITPELYGILNDLLPAF